MCIITLYVTRDSGTHLAGVYYFLSGFEEINNFVVGHLYWEARVAKNYRHPLGEEGSFCFHGQQETKS